MANKNTFILALIFIAFLTMRFVNLGEHTPHIDESKALVYSDDSFAGLIHTLKTEDPHPPFYYSLVKIWIDFGRKLEIIQNKPIAEIIEEPADINVMRFIRFPGIILSAITFFLIYFFAGKIYGKTPALFALVFFAGSRMETYWCQSIRYYSMIALLSFSSSIVFYLIQEKQKSRGGKKAEKNQCAADPQTANPYSGRKEFLMFALYAALSILGFYTQYFMGLIMFSHFLYLIIKKKLSYKWLIAWAVIAIGFIPWIPVFLEQFNIVGKEAYGTAKISIASIPLTLYRLLFSYGLESETPVEGFAYLAALIALVIILYFAMKSNNRFIWIYTFTPYIILFALSLRKPLFSPAYFLITFPGYCIFLGRGATTMFELIQLRFKPKKNDIK